MLFEVVKFAGGRIVDPRRAVQALQPSMSASSLRADRPGGLDIKFIPPLEEELRIQRYLSADRTLSSGDCLRTLFHNEIPLLGRIRHRSIRSRLRRPPLKRSLREDAFPVVFIPSPSSMLPARRARCSSQRFSVSVDAMGTCLDPMGFTRRFSMKDVRLDNSSWRPAAAVLRLIQSSLSPLNLAEAFFPAPHGADLVTLFLFSCSLPFPFSLGANPVQTVTLMISFFFFY